MNKAWWERPCVSQQVVTKQLQLWLDLSHLPSSNLWLNLFRSWNERLTMKFWTKSSKPVCAFYPYERYSVFVISNVPISKVGSGKSCTSNLLDRWWSLLTLSAGLMEHDGTKDGPCKRDKFHRSFRLHSPKRHFCGSSLGKRRCFLVGSRLVQKKVQHFCIQRAHLILCTILWM